MDSLLFLFDLTPKRELELKVKKLEAAAAAGGGGGGGGDSAEVKALQEKVRLVTLKESTMHHTCRILVWNVVKLKILRSFNKSLI